jgi:prepilin-type N-terminal cleavage/methylation domain-containing protein
MNERKNYSHGFTMVEMMITVVIVGVMAGLAVPQFGPAYDRMKMRAASRDLASDFRLARSMAISDKEQYGLFFDATAKTITLFQDKANPALFKFESSDSVITVDTLPPEFVWIGTDCTNDVMAFKPNGSAGFGGGGNIWAMAISENAICINTTNILASTGRVQSNTYLY